MSQLPQDSGSGWPTWLAAIVPVGVALGIVWGVIKGYFELSTRSELKEYLAAQDEKFLNAMTQQRAEQTAMREDFRRALEAVRDDLERSHELLRNEQLRLHSENSHTARETFGRVSSLEKGLSKIEGHLDALSSSGIFKGISK
jgi:hypothetical protein